MRQFPGTAGLLAGLILLPGCEQLPNIPPQAAFVYSPVSPILGGQTNVVFNASGSRDSDGTIVSYVWNFGDGSPDQTTTGPTVGHVFPDTAARCLEITYTVLLTVVDDGGERATASAAVKVTELPFPTDVACLPPTR
jgi:chitinase